MKVDYSRVRSCPALYWKPQDSAVVHKSHLVVTLNIIGMKHLFIPELKVAAIIAIPLVQ